jgi:hypothetical protein
MPFRTNNTKTVPMRPTRYPPWQLWKVMLALVLFALAVGWLYQSMHESSRSDSFTGVGLTGVQHIGPNFNISEFYVDGYYGSNVGREGGGGRHVCCVSLPKKWRPG